MSGWIDYETHRPEARAVAERLKAFPRVEDPATGRAREILVHLPPTHDDADRTYPVLYMLDGQNLFDEGTSFAGSWRVGETMERLAAEGLEAIVVGVPNAGTARMDEYAPFRDRKLGGGAAAGHLRFLVETVKPLVDEAFRTSPRPAETGIVGSSMGGLFSLWAFFERPDVFGLAGAMSPSLGFAKGAILDRLDRGIRRAGRLYLDCGSLEGATGGSWWGRRRARAYVRRVRTAREILIRHGYREGEDLLYVEDRDARHDEGAWARRLPRALRFLLGAG